MRRISIIFIIAGLTACSTTAIQNNVATTSPAVVAKPKQADTPDTWRQSTTTDVISGEAWWTAWNDESIAALIKQAMQANPEIRIAEARLGAIEKTASSADPDEKIIALAALEAAKNDVRVARQAAAHAVAAAYLDARLAVDRQAHLSTRLQLGQELTETLRKRLAAGLGNATSLNEQAQADIELRLSLTQAQQAHEQAIIRLALLLGQSPATFTLKTGTSPLSSDLKAPIDTPAQVIARRPDVQSAWQRLLIAYAAQSDDDLPITMQIEQSETSSATRDALYRQSVLTALQDVELALAAWHTSATTLSSAQDSLRLQSLQTASVQRAVNSGRMSKVELLKARLAENLSQENVITAIHAKNLAYAALLLANAHE
jgi:outer membrane protein TolC